MDTSTDQAIKDAIAKASPGIAKYLHIMDALPATNVATDAEFQRAFNDFYKVRQRSAAWYQGFYGLMQQLKGTRPTFDDVLDAMQAATQGRCEPSFSSKLVATLDPSKPIWDKFVLENTGHVAPRYGHPQRVALAKEVYRSIEAWYVQFMNSAEGRRYIALFDQQVPEHQRITDIKKVDFILWQMRGA